MKALDNKPTKNSTDSDWREILVPSWSKSKKMLSWKVGLQEAWQERSTNRLKNAQSYFWEPNWENDPKCLQNFRNKDVHHWIVQSKIFEQLTT